MSINGKKAVTVPAVEKALDIMEYIARQGKAVAIKDITATLDIPPATAYRTVKYLCSRKYLKETVQAEYALGPQLLYLTDLIAKQFDMIIEAEPIMKELATRSGQTAQLGILQDLGVMYIQQSLPPTPVNIIATLRTVIPVNISASGKILVAHLPQREQEYFLHHATLLAQTKNSIVDIDEFKQELNTVKEQGYAQDREEYARGIGCVAAPVWNHRDQVIAAVGITGQIADYQDDANLNRLIGLVKFAAEELSTNIGFREER